MSSRLPKIRVPVSLRRLFPHSSFVGCADVRVADATERSGECTANSLFAAIPGTRLDGSHFVDEAIERGATSLLVQRPLAHVSVPQCVVPNVRKAYAELCAALAGSPSQRLGLAAVTGTNGKTTVTWLIRSILQAAGKRTGLLGTIEYSDGFDVEPPSLTTPDSKTLSNSLSAMVSRGTTHAAIELSSHALHQDRAAGTQIEIAIVTNITQDHFDYHENHESYLSSKARILDHCRKGGLVVLNGDNPGSASLREQVDPFLDLKSYGLGVPADISATILEESSTGSRFLMNIEGERLEVRTSLVGRHNVSNCLAAAAAAARFGVPPDVIAAGIESLASVPGRLERIDCGQSCDVFVDYAHTDDALRRCIHSLKSLARGRLICVFGAGGDRDRSKRPLLGRAASEADVAVITSDNPRTEDPEQIIQDVLGGFRFAPREPHVVPDRAEAIGWALKHAGPDDTVLVAGKGHERGQILGTEQIPFDDREVVRNCLFGFALASRRRHERLPA